MTKPMQEEAGKAATTIHPSSDQETQDVKQKEVVQLFNNGGSGASAQNLAGTGFSYRQDWGARHGDWKLTLNWGAITCNSKVFVSAHEVTGACAFVGAAKYTVHNIAPFNGGITVWIKVDWSSDIRVRLDYLVVNP